MRILTIKDVANELEVSRSTAKRYIKDMKEYYNPPSKRLVIGHLEDYFNIPQLKRVKKV